MKPGGLQHRYWPANNLAVTAGAAARTASACTELWNLSPDHRAGQPEERLTTVTLYIAARRRFFQFEMPVRNRTLTKRTTANSGPLQPQPVNTEA